MQYNKQPQTVTYLDSTETMVSEENGWKIIQKNSLPRPMSFLRGISIQNQIIMTGRIDFMSAVFLHS